MRRFPEAEEVDLCIVGAGAGGSVLSIAIKASWLSDGRSLFNQSPSTNCTLGAFVMSSVLLASAYQNCACEIVMPVTCAPRSRARMRACS